MDKVEIESDLPILEHPVPENVSRMERREIQGALSAFWISSPVNGTDWE